VNPGRPSRCSNSPASIKNPEELFLLLVGVLLLRHHDNSPLGVATTARIQAGEGKLYLRAVKDVFSNQIVGCSIDHRMKSTLAVRALENAAQMRGDVAGCSC